MSQIRIVVADDHTIVLDGLCRLLESEFELVATVTDGRALVAKVREVKPDVVIADVAMPFLNGLEALQQVRTAGLRTRFVFLTANSDISLAARAFRLGASGYVLKHSATEELTKAIREAMAGQTYITSSIAADVLQNVLSGEGGDAGTNLTVREREVLQLVAEGHSIKEAAAILKVSPRTVEFHKRNITDKTGLHSTAELARYAARNGFV
ncbi:MAG: response regulator transcription factor [Bryobacteraceae bacterium]